VRGGDSTVRYSSGPRTTRGGTTGGSDRGSSSARGGSSIIPDSSAAIDLGGSITPRHTPLPRFSGSSKPDRASGEVRPSAGYTARTRTRTRPSPTGAATIPGRSLNAADLTSRYRGAGSRAASPARGSGTSAPGGTMLSAGRRGVTSTSDTTSGTNDRAAYRKRAANAAKKQKQRMNRLGKADPNRANQVDMAGRAVGNAFESGLDLGTRILTGGKVGSGVLLGKTRGVKTKSGKNNGNKTDGKLGGRDKSGGLSKSDGPRKPGGKGTPGGDSTTGKSGGLSDPSDRSGGAGPGPGGDNYGGKYVDDGSYYNNYYDCYDNRYWFGQCGVRAGWCSPYSAWGYTPIGWLGWGWNCVWDWYWYGLGYAWYYPRYSTYQVPIYDVTTQIVYQSVVPEEQITYIETAQSDVDAFTGEPSDETLQPDQQQVLTRASDYYLELGDRSFRDGKYGDAVHFYAKAVEFGEHNGVLYMVLADALFATGDYHYAAYAMRRALELDPALIDGTVDKRGFYTDASDFDGQMELLERYVEDHFLDQDARLVLIINYMFSGRDKAALTLLQDDFTGETAATPIGGLLRKRLESR